MFSPETYRRLPLEDFEEEASDALPFLRFRLTKRGLDTLEAVDALANACHLSAQKFGFAGIKDSFAITTQDEGSDRVMEKRSVPCTPSVHTILPVQISNNNSYYYDDDYCY